ncbi:CRE-SET-25 protein [Caenorhabditis remanei]|uniref:CRE-SET-25 protein n=1 Tax=Caenorhabditis remanei TaxID=31234 RepID=E3M8J0_CAERE|nr:CRE-SET-25 protein [Caenorhabditis remanei]
MSAYDITQYKTPSELAELVMNGSDSGSDSDVEVIAVINKKADNNVAPERRKSVPSEETSEKEIKREEEEEVIEELRRRTINVALEEEVKENRNSSQTNVKSPLKMASTTTSPRTPSKDNKSLRERSQRSRATPTNSAPSSKKRPAVSSSSAKSSPRDKPSTSSNQSSILRYLTPTTTPKQDGTPSKMPRTDSSTLTSPRRATSTRTPSSILTATVSPRNHNRDTVQANVKSPRPRTVSFGCSTSENATSSGPSTTAHGAAKRVRPLSESSPPNGPSTSSGIPSKRRSENINRRDSLNIPVLRARQDLNLTTSSSTPSSSTSTTNFNARRTRTEGVSRRSTDRAVPPPTTTQQSRQTDPRRGSNLKRKAPETSEIQPPKVIKTIVEHTEPVAPPTISNDPDELRLIAYYSDEEPEDPITVEDTGRRHEKLLRVPVALITHPDLEETRYPPSRRGNKNKTNKRRKKASEEETTTVETSKNLSYRVNRRVKVIRKFVPRIPKSCFEALRASELGSSERKRPFTGIPSRKFDTRDNKQYGNGQKMNWDVQAVYQFQCEDDAEYSFVLYEGWTSTSMDRQKNSELLVTSKEMLELAVIRDTFLAAFKKRAEQKAREFVAKSAEKGEIVSFETALERFYNKWAPPRETWRPFWLHEDVTYFHTLHHKEHILGPIWYMDLINASAEKPPEYGYTAVNILTYEAYMHCKNSSASLPFEQLAEKIIGKNYVFLPASEGSCENLLGCKCTARFELLYGAHNPNNVYTKTKEILLQKDGTIDLTGYYFDLSRVIVECSDECGCSWRCPRRRLQQGQTKPVVVCREHGKGYGLRAAQSFKKGELVCEYTGNMFMLDPDEIHPIYTIPFRTEKIEERNAKQKKQVEEPRREEKKEPPRDASYEAALNVTGREMVICAKNNGNIARFVNHACDPNTAFFEVDSRRYIEDPLIPRVAIYAIKDIELAEEINVAYWDPLLKYSKLSTLECDCGAEKCIKFLPTENTTID